jgi:hypothetical protein
VLENVPEWGDLGRHGRRDPEVEILPEVSDLDASGDRSLQSEPQRAVRAGFGWRGVGVRIFGRPEFFEIAAIVGGSINDK